MDSITSKDVSSHAPLLDRLRGNAFLPGVHYATQAEAWMLEAAAEIEVLQGELRKAMEQVQTVVAECIQLRAAGETRDEHAESTNADLFNAGVNIAKDRQQMREALEVCGRYLATLNRGGTQGFNAACRAVEQALVIDSVSQIPAPTTTEVLP